MLICKEGVISLIGKERLREILEERKGRLRNSVDPDTLQFLENRILGGGSIFGLEMDERIKKVAYGIWQKRGGGWSLEEEMKDDFEKASLILEIRRYNFILDKLDKKT